MSLRQAAQDFSNTLISRRVASRFVEAANPAALKAQAQALLKKIDEIDAGSPKKEMQKHVSEIKQVGQKLEKHLESLDGKMEDAKLNRAIERAQAVGAYAEDIERDAGDAKKVDKHLSGVQKELKEALKLL